MAYNYKYERDKTHTYHRGRFAAFCKSEFHSKIPFVAKLTYLALSEVVTPKALQYNKLVILLIFDWLKDMKFLQKHTPSFQLQKIYNY